MKTQYIKCNVLSFLVFCCFLFSGVVRGFDIETLRLNNGLEFYLIKTENPVITYATWVQAGGVDEVNGKVGVAHFVEHMMFKDNTKFTGATLTKLLHSTAGIYNALTTYDFTIYYNTVPNNTLPLVMRLEASRLQGLVLDPVQFEEERKVILEERGLRIDNNPMNNYFEYINYYMYPFNSYGRSLIGSIKDIENITINDVKDFYDTYYRPENIKIFIIGNIDFKDLKRYATKYYSTLPKSKKNIMHYNQVVDNTYRYNVTVELQDKSVVQPIFGITYLAPSLQHSNEHNQVLALMLLQKYLNSETSKFYRVLVKEKNLTSNLSVSYQPLSRFNTAFNILFMLNNSANFSVMKNETNKILQEISEQGISNNELESLYKQLQDELIYLKDDQFLLLLMFAKLIMAGFSTTEVNDLLHFSQSLDHQAINQFISHYLRGNKMYLRISN